MQPQPLTLLVLVVQMLVTMMRLGCVDGFTRSLQHSERVSVRGVRLMMSKKLEVRPTLDDIERISRGQAAKRRGTGSRAVPHRLNSAERTEWDLAKKRRFLLLRGTGWRKERGDSPLANIYRNYCDACAVPCISVARGVGVGEELTDEVIIDFSPLRTKEVGHFAHEGIELAKTFGSLASVTDNSNIETLGWDMSDISLEEDVIWRLPVFCLKASFSSRADSRKFAESFALKFAGGTQSDTEKESGPDVTEAESADGDAGSSAKATKGKNKAQKSRPVRSRMAKTDRFARMDEDDYDDDESY